VDPKVCENLDEDLKKSWDEFCKSEGKKGTKLGIDAGLAIPNTVLNVVKGFFTPEGIKMLAEFIGVETVGKLTMNGMLRGIAQFSGTSAYKVAAEQATTEGAWVVNNAMLSSALAEGLEEATFARAAFNFSKFVGRSVGRLWNGLMIVQLLTAVVDVWDPAGYNQEISAEVLEKITNKCNDGFKDNILKGFIVGRDVNNNPIYERKWPVEFHLDNILASEFDKEEEQVERIKHSLEYVNNLKFNVYGEKIKDKKDDVALLKPSDFKRATNEYLLMLSDNNTVFTNFLKKYWPVLLSLVILFIIILFKTTKE